MPKHLLPENLQLPSPPVAPKRWQLMTAAVTITVVASAITIWSKTLDPEKKSTTVPSAQVSLHSTASPQPTPSIPPPVSSLPPPPSKKILTGGTHAFQTFNNCGPAALSMALSYYGITQSQQTLGAALRPHQQAQGNNDDKSVTLREVAVKAQEYDLLTYQRPAGSIALIEALVTADIPVITRTWLRTGEDIGHFRVVRGYDREKQIILQDDSLQGKSLEYSYEAFTQLWAAFNYEFLVLVTPEKQTSVEQILGELANEQLAWQKAVALATAELSTNPNDVYAGFNTSVALYYLGEYQASVQAYEAVADRLPSRMLWYQLEPVLAYYQLGSYDQVNKLADSILNNQNRAYSELYYLKGLVAQQRNQAEQARGYFATADRYNQSHYWKVNVP